MRKPEPGETVFPKAIEKRRCVATLVTECKSPDYGTVHHVHDGTEGYFHALKVHRYNPFKSLHFLGARINTIINYKTARLIPGRMDTGNSEKMSYSK